MPGFLLLSGFLVNFNKPVKKFLVDNLQRIFWPHLLFASVYIFASVFCQKFGIPIQGGVDTISVSEIIKILFLGSTGTYWYLYTLFVCNILYYFCKYIFADNFINSIILFSAVLFAMSLIGNNIDMGNCLFYIIGIVLQSITKEYKIAVKPSLLAVLPVIAIIIYKFPELNRYSINGVIVTYCVLCFISSVYWQLKDKKKIITWIGKNSYSVVLFSPYFSILSLLFTKYFLNFDKTEILYRIFGTLFTVAGCLFTSFILTKLKISLYLTGDKKFYKHYGSTR
jgi:hypothetical protein